MFTIDVDISCVKNEDAMKDMEISRANKDLAETIEGNPIGYDSKSLT